MNARDTQRFTPSKRPYVVFTIIFVPVSLYAFFISLMREEISLAYASTSLILLWFGVCLWLYSNRIEFTVGGVTQGRFSVFRRHLKFSEIKGFYTFVGFRDKHGRTGPFFRFVIEPKTNCHKKAIMFPARIFAVGDYRAMIELLSKHGIPELKGTSIVKDSVVKTLFTRRR